MEVLRLSFDVLDECCAANMVRCVLNYFVFACFLPLGDVKNSNGISIVSCDENQGC